MCICSFLLLGSGPLGILKFDPSYCFNNLRYADDSTLMAEIKEELKSLLMKLKEESEKAGLKLNITKTKNMAFGPVTLWQIDGERLGRVTDYFLGLQNHCKKKQKQKNKITADDDSSHEIKRCLLLGTKAMTNLDIKKIIIIKAETLLCRQMSD